jgi:hypothetical protein
MDTNRLANKVYILHNLNYLAHHFENILACTYYLNSFHLKLWKTVFQPFTNPDLLWNRHTFTSKGKTSCIQNSLSQPEVTQFLNSNKSRKTDPIDIFTY